MEKPIELSSRGLINTLLISCDDIFTFVVGGHEHQTSVFIASFLSQYVCELLVSDPTIRSFVVDIDDNDYQFSFILGLCTGQRIMMTSENYCYFLLVGTKLNNRELIEKALEIKENELCPSMIVDALNQNYEFYFVPPEMLKYAAENFYLIPEEKLINLEPYLLVEIISSPYLRIYDEDTLFDLVVKFIRVYPSFKLSLLSCISCEYLSDSSITFYASMISIEDLTLDIWTSIKRRLVFTSNASDDINRFYIPGKVFKFRPVNPLNGIFKYLEDTSGGNIAENGTISIIGCKQSMNLNSMVDSTKTDICYTYSKSSERYITFDFKDRKVNLKAYSILSGCKNMCMKTWIMRGSNDGQRWVDLDVRINEFSMLNSNVVHRFVCPPTKQSYRMIQIYSDLPNWADKLALGLSRIEMFGILS